VFAWVRVSQAMKRLFVPAGRLLSVRFCVFVIAMPIRLCRALKPTSVTGPRPRLMVPPHSQLGGVVPSSYLAWNPRACRSRSPTCGYRSSFWIRLVSATWEIAEIPYPVCTKSRQVSCVSPSTKVDCPCQYPMISALVSMPPLGGATGMAPSLVR
jgi:hypothetical protein